MSRDAVEPRCRVQLNGADASLVHVQKLVWKSQLYPVGVGVVGLVVEGLAVVGGLGTAVDG